MSKELHNTECVALEYVREALRLLGESDKFMHIGFKQDYPERDIRFQCVLALNNRGIEVDTTTQFNRQRGRWRPVAFKFRYFRGPKTGEVVEFEFLGTTERELQLKKH